jgi:hypothetical protein
MMHKTPPILVKAAYNKSVPTAVVGGMPNHNKMGVIKDPPLHLSIPPLNLPVNSNYKSLIENP